MTPLTDPAQFLTQLFRSGQEFVRQFAGASAMGASSPAADTDFMAAPQQFAEMQQRMLESFPRSGHWPAAPRPRAKIGVLPTPPGATTRALIWCAALISAMRVS